MFDDLPPFRSLRKSVRRRAAVREYGHTVSELDGRRPRRLARSLVFFAAWRFVATADTRCHALSLSRLPDRAVGEAALLDATLGPTCKVRLAVSLPRKLSQRTNTSVVLGQSLSKAHHDFFRSAATPQRFFWTLLRSASEVPKTLRHFRKRRPQGKITRCHSVAGGDSGSFLRCQEEHES